jgi:hypothetical protein
VRCALLSSALALVPFYSVDKATGRLQGMLRTEASWGRDAVAPGETMRRGRAATGLSKRSWATGKCMTPHSVIRTGCLIGAIAGSGCSSHSPYPVIWPAVPRTAQRTCEQLLGTYRDRGVYGTGASPRSLTELLLGQNGRTWRAESVTLSFPRVGQIQIGVSGPVEQSSSTTLSAEDGRFVCQTGSVMIRRPAHWSLGLASPGLPGLGRESQTLELFSAGDYLVVKQKQQIFMLVGFMLPVGGRETHWYRFERATRVPERKPESSQAGSSEKKSMRAAVRSRHYGQIRRG